MPITDLNPTVSPTPASPTPASLIPAASADGLTLRVTAKRLIADGVCELTLTDPDGLRLPDWSPGSHIDVILPGDVVRQYSLCGDRWDPSTYRIAVLLEPEGRGGSTYIHHALAVGDLLPIGGPRNNFHLTPAPAHVFIAGGIGITPILAMIRQVGFLGSEWTLHYGGRSRASMAYADELADDPRVRLRPADEYGLLDIDEAIAESPDDAVIYCCGPEALLTAVQTVGDRLRPGHVHIERFVPREMSAPVRDKDFEVWCDRSRTSVTVTPDTSVIDALNAAGLSVLSSCRRGVCGTCQTDVLDGIPDHRDSILTDDERAAGDSMLICVSRSRTDRITLDL